MSARETSTPFQVLDPAGTIVGEAPQIPTRICAGCWSRPAHEESSISMLSLQRQGRIGFYGTATGQEAAIAGSAYPPEGSRLGLPHAPRVGISLSRRTTLQEIVCS